MDQDYEMIDTNGDRWVHQHAYITTTVNQNMTLSTQDAPSTITLNLTQAQNVPYSFVIKYASNLSEIDYNIDTWISLDDSLLTYGNSSVDVTFTPSNYPLPPLGYDIVNLSFDWSLLAGTPYSTVSQSVAVQITIKSDQDGAYVTDSADQSCRYCKLQRKYHIL